MEDDRLNSPSTSAIIVEAFGHRLHLSQDPNSKHLGTTVWDASLVFIKYLEKNCRKGRFCLTKLKGKRAIELGAGCGLAGIGMALLGCDVVSTDQNEVLPLLMRNVERNTSYIMQANPDSASFGTIEVAELDWGNKDHIKAVNPPFDYIIGTDVVYSEHLLEPLRQTILALSGPRTTVLLGYEIRSTTVHEQMFQMWKSNFEVKTVSKAKMDSKYQHPSIYLYIMEPKPQPLCEDNISVTCQTPNSNLGSNDNEDDESGGLDGKEYKERETVVSAEIPVLKNGDVDEWEIRRYGSMAARLLRDVQIR